jgi:dTDP-4-amino-4,6-dideoxygalactose transaminase
VAGDGGVVTTDSDDLCQRLKKLRNHGLKNRDEIQFFGYNSRLDSIQAIVANGSLSRLDEITERRINNAKLYDKLLSGLEGNVVIPARRPKMKQVFHTYVVQVKERERLMGYLAKNGVETKIHYPVPIHLQKPCRMMGYQGGDLPETEKQVGRILSLPIHQYLTKEQILYVADTLKRFYGSK